MPFTYRVDREFFDKYENLAKQLGLKFNELSYKQFGYACREDLVADFVNGAQLSKAQCDKWATSMRVFQERRVKHLLGFELACLGKHLLVRDTIGATAVFTRGAHHGQG